VVFALLWVNDRRKGGYRAERIGDESLSSRPEPAGVH
jgi:hypothetical protein